MTTLTSVTGGFTAAMVGNIIQISSGTNFTAGFYQITAFTNSNTVTLDRAPSTAAGSAGHGSVGGALATLTTLATAMVGSNKAYVTGAFTTTATITFAQSVSATFSVPPTRLIGYGSVRGDTGHATLTLSTNTGLIGINATGISFWVEQVDVNAASLGTSTCIQATFGGQVQRSKLSNYTNYGFIAANSENTIIDCEITGGGTGATAGVKVNATSFVLRNYIHDNTGIGIWSNGSGTTISQNIVNNCTSNGMLVNFENCIENNTVHASGLNGIAYNTDTVVGLNVRNNLLTSNGNYGLRMDVSGALPAAWQYDGNAYWNNTSGTRLNADSTTGIYGVNSYTNVNDVILTGSPYVGPTTGATANFGLNNTAGAGAACRASATPGTWPGIASTLNFLDMGAVQHQDTPSGGRGGGMIIVQGGVTAMM